MQVSYEGGDPRIPRAQQGGLKGEEGGREATKVSAEHVPGRNGPHATGALRETAWGTLRTAAPHGWARKPPVHQPPPPLGH